MIPSKKSARFVGLLYLFLVFSGLFNLMYVPAKLIVKNDATATASNILAHQSLFRIDLAIGLVSTVIFLFVAMLLYRMLRDVNPQYAAVMVVLVAISVAQSFVSNLLWVGTLELVRGTDLLSAIDKPQRDALAMFCLHMNTQGAYLAEMFWGLWLLPLGMLVYRSGFIPRFVGVWLIINGIAYVIMCLTGLLTPEYYALVAKISFPAMLGEVALTLWLLIMGVRTSPAIAQT
jgi:hypothetical protein